MRSKTRAVALSFAISLGIFATSCIEVDKTLGIDNIPDEYALKLHTSSVGLPLQTKMLDSLQALNTSIAVLGAFRTPEFGMATFSFATNYAPYSVKQVSWGTSRTIKNIYLTLQRSSSSVMDNSQIGLPQNIHVYRMTRVIDTTSKYNGDLKDSDYIHTPIDSGGVVYTGGDTLRVWLKKSFGQLLLQATQKEIDSSSIFMDRFKALLFTCDAPEEGSYGGRLNSFSTANAFIYLTFNFQPTWASGLNRKDTTVVIPLGDNTYTQNFSTYESKSQESTDPKEYLYVEGSGGIKAYADPLVLKDTLDKWVAKLGLDPKKIVICKATYNLPFVTDNSTVSMINRCFPASLYPHYKEKDTSNVYYYSPLDDVYSNSNNAGGINRSLSNFNGDISTIVQRLISKERQEIQSNWKKYAMWFTPVNKNTSSSYYSESSSTTFSIDRESYSIGKINGPLHANRPTITIVYAVMND